ncbi:DUF58 domain-containing protein [Thioalkalivibrio sulfidiphilus]|uniref:DUF58 domain-containing protein n=1 Tax=Thioalkalivibrio sulfidiphilus TaxID=1033854 RepID=UPI003B2DCAD0
MKLAAQILEPAVTWLMRREHPAGREITLHRRRIYILPTRQGLVFGLMLVVMLLGAINYSNSMAFLLTFLLAGLGANGIWHTHRNLLGLRITRLPLEPVFAGETAYCRYRIENPSHVPRRGLVLHRRDVQGAAIAAQARAEAVAELPIVTTRRGSLRPGRFSLSTTYPLGLFRAWSWIQFDEALTVYPHPLAVDERFTDAGSSEGEGRPDPGLGEDFSGLREYQPGDSPRRVDWKALARTGDLYTRNFESPRGGELWIDWHALPATDTETRLSMLCHQVLLAHQQGIRYGLRLPGLELEPDQGADHRHRCLSALAHYGQPAQGSPAP